LMTYLLKRFIINLIVNHSYRLLLFSVDSFEAKFYCYFSFPPYGEFDLGDVFGILFIFRSLGDITMLD
jgi:hypothetical protein